MQRAKATSSRNGQLSAVLPSVSPLLSYTLANPFFIQASAPTASNSTPNLVNLSISFNNNSKNPVYLSSLEIDIPIGTGAGFLSNSGIFEANISDTSNFSVKNTKGVISITSNSSAGTQITDVYTLYLTNIVVNQTPGDVTLNLTETSVNGVTPVTPSKKTSSLTLSIAPLLPALLSYSLSSSPFPIQASASSPENLANLSIIFNNNSTNPVYLSSLQIEIPIGGDAGSLSNNTSFNPNISGNDFSVENDSGVINITSNSPNGSTLITNGYTLYLRNISVNEAPGNVIFSLFENSSNSASDMPSTKTSTLILTKIDPNAPLIKDFQAYLNTATPPVSSIPSGTGIFLNWQCQPTTSSTVSLSWPGQSPIDVSNKPNATGTGNQYRYPSGTGLIRLEKDTVFTLSATYNDWNNDAVTDIYQCSVSVVPVEHIKTFKLDIGSVGNQPTGIAISPDDQYAYLACWGDGAISRVNLQTNQVEQGFIQKLVSNPGAMALSSDGRYLCSVANHMKTLWVIDLANNNQVYSVTVGDGPYAVAISPKAPYTAYVSNEEDNTVSIISLTTPPTVTSLTVGNSPKGVAVSSDGGYLCVANSGDATVSIFALNQNPPKPVNIVNIKTGSSPKQLVISQDGAYLYASSSGGSATGVSVIDLSKINDTDNDSFIGTIAIKQATLPFAIALSQDGNTLYVSDTDNKVNMVSVIDVTQWRYNQVPPATANVIASFSLQDVQALALTSDSQRLCMVRTTQNLFSIAKVQRVGANPAPAKIENFYVEPYFFYLGDTATLSWCLNESAAYCNLYDGLTLIASNLTGNSYLELPTKNRNYILRAYDNTGQLGDNRVHSIDFLTPKLLPSVPVGQRPIAITISSDGLHAYVANYFDSSVSMIETATNKVTTIDVYLLPLSIAITPDGRYVYVGNSYDPKNWFGSISVIDTQDINNVVQIKLDAANITPASIAITPDGLYAYVVDGSSYFVYVIDTTGPKVVGQPIKVGTHPQSIAITPDGRYAYVANQDDGNVSVININTRTTLDKPIKVGTKPSSIAITTDGCYAYVANRDDGNVSVIDTQTNEVVDNISIGSDSSPQAIAIRPDGICAYVANVGSSFNSVSVIYVQTNTVLGTISVGANPQGIAITPDGNYAYVANHDSNTVSVLAIYNAINTTNVKTAMTRPTEVISPLRRLAPSSSSSASLDTRQGLSHSNMLHQGNQVATRLFTPLATRAFKANSLTRQLDLDEKLMKLNTLKTCLQEVNDELDKPAVNPITPGYALKRLNQQLNHFNPTQTSLTASQGETTQPDCGCSLKNAKVIRR